MDGLVKTVEELPLLTLVTVNYVSINRVVANCITMNFVILKYVTANFVNYVIANVTTAILLPT